MRILLRNIVSTSLVLRREWYFFVHSWLQEIETNNKNRIFSSFIIESYEFNSQMTFSIFHFAISCYFFFVLLLCFACCIRSTEKCQTRIYLFFSFFKISCQSTIETARKRFWLSDVRSLGSSRSRGYICIYDVVAVSESIIFIFSNIIAA